MKLGHQVHVNEALLNSNNGPRNHFDSPQSFHSRHGSAVSIGSHSNVIPVPHKVQFFAHAANQSFSSRRSSKRGSDADGSMHGYSSLGGGGGHTMSSHVVEASTAIN